MSHPSEVRKRVPRVTYVGPSVIEETSLYRPLKRGARLNGAKPMPLFDSSAEASTGQPNVDTFNVGVRFYDKPPTTENAGEVWRGLLTQRLTVTRVLDDEGEPLRQATDMGVFCLFYGIPDMGPKWIDIRRATQPTRRRPR